MTHEVSTKVVDDDAYSFEHLIFEFRICFVFRYSNLMLYLMLDNMTLLAATGDLFGNDRNDLSGPGGGAAGLCYRFRNIHRSLSAPTNEHARTGSIQRYNWIGLEKAVFIQLQPHEFGQLGSGGRGDTGGCQNHHIEGLVLHLSSGSGLIPNYGIVGFVLGDLRYPTADVVDVGRLAAPQLVLLESPTYGPKVHAKYRGGRLIIMLVGDHRLFNRVHAAV